MAGSVAKVNGTAGLGPIGAVGIVVALITMMTLLPAALAIFGRRAFWPLVPYGPSGELPPIGLPRWLARIAPIRLPCRTRRASASPRAIP